MYTWISDGPLGTANIVDLIDVGLLALVIYLVLRVLRGTRAFQSLIGLMLLAAIYLISDVVGLSTLHWVLNNIFVYAVLGLLILFQDDIRRVLAQAGGTMLAGRAPLEAVDVHVIEEIGKAIFLMASRRVGVLLAIERSASLQPFAESGERVDAVTSSALLQAIFHHTSPLHDGAVLIRGGRMTEAGVFLPLSQSRTLPKVYGTRHRAAVGLTEKTDAVVIVVSEERGTVSVAADGVVTAMSDPNDLRQHLQALFRQTGDTPSKALPEESRDA